MTIEFVVDICRRNTMSRAKTRTTPGNLLELPDSWTPLVGQQFGKLTVLGYTGRMTRHQQKMITCQCACGLYTDTMTARLKNGTATSCGCEASRLLAERNAANTKHGASSGGKPLPYLYRTWNQIKARCYSKSHTAYPDYGGRGILMHQPWRTSYQAFVDDVTAAIGPRPNRSHSLDRIDNNKGYEIGNLRWATSMQQNRNRRNTKFYELGGEKRSLADWADLAGAKYDTVKSRILTYGWPLEEALGTPSGAGRCPAHERRKWSPQKV